MSELADAVARGDLDELVRLVDGMCAGRRWGSLVDLRDRCRHALEERGLQLWPAAEYAEYRMALEAPGEFAGPLVVEGAGRFALGPLWEVAASTHTWAELEPHLPPGPARTLAAHERVLRGENLAGDASVDPLVLELPLTMEPWEPRYPVAAFFADRVEFPPPVMAEVRAAEPAPPAPTIQDPEGTEALIELAEPWSEQSNGRVAAVAVSGDAVGAMAASYPGPIAFTRIQGSDALALMAWTAAGGGAYGRRRGGPLGRFGAWWVVATLGGIAWPPEQAELGAALDRLIWVRWEPADVSHGWVGCLAVEDPVRGLAWALYAVDDHREGDQPT